MIDITIHEDKVSVEHKNYYNLENPDILGDLIEEVIEKAKFSGESITLWIVNKDVLTKRLVQDW